MDILIFSPSGANRPCTVDLGPMAQYLESTETNLGVKMDRDFILDRSISAVVKCSFYQLRQFAMGKHIISYQDLKSLTYSFITTILITIIYFTLVCHNLASFVCKWFKMQLHGL